MRKKGIRKGMKLLTALLLAASVLFGTFGNIQSVQAASKDDYYLKVNKGTNVVTVYKKDGTPYTAFACSTGGSETPNGTFYMKEKYRWHQLYHDCYGQYCTRITGHVLFHSVWYYENKNPKSQSGRQYNRLGTTASSGCCRLTVAAAKWIYDNCPYGTKVIIFSGTEKDDPLGKPETIKVPEVRGWDPTDPDPDNPYKTKSTTPVISVSSKTLACGSKFGNGNMTCKDSGGFDITDWVKQEGKVNMKKLGTYPVTYSVIDSFGRTATKTVNYRVVDKNAAMLTGVKSSITKKNGTTLNMRAGIKAKDAAGVDLTKKIALYIKTPSSEKYEKYTGTTYTFKEEGTYRVKYIVKNPNNGKKTTKKMIVKIVNDDPPVLTSADDWKEMSVEQDQVVSRKELMNGVSAKLTNGTDVIDSVEIVIQSPSDDEGIVFEKGQYQFCEVGTYTILYTAYNGKRLTERKRTVTVKAESQAEVILDE